MTAYSPSLAGEATLARKRTLDRPAGGPHFDVRRQQQPAGTGNALANLLMQPRSAVLGKTGSIMLAVMICLASTAASRAHPADDLISSQAAARQGLERSWFTYVRVDPSRHHVVHWTLDADHLFALTSDGTVQALQSETGQTCWTTTIASPADTSVGLAVNAEVVAVLAATRLYLLNRQDGRQLWSRPLTGAASSAPALSAGYVYVSLLGGRLEGFDIQNLRRAVWHYQTSGHNYHGPATTPQVVSWSNDQGGFFAGSAEDPRPLWRRLHPHDPLVTTPAAATPYLYTASEDGYLTCYEELSGRERWRYSAGLPITTKPAIVADRAYVTTLDPALHGVDLTTGQRVWQVAGIRQFVAQGQSAIYGLDAQGSVVLMDPETGSVYGRLASSPQVTAIANEQTDRLFLVNQQGLVQCWREIGSREPVRYRQSPQLDPPPAPVAAEEAAPASEEDAPAEPEDNPFENPFF